MSAADSNLILQFTHFQILGGKFLFGLSCLAGSSSSGSAAVDSRMALIKWRGANIGMGELGEKEGGTKLESCDDGGISEVERSGKGDLEVFESCGIPVNGLIRGLI